MVGRRHAQVLSLAAFTFACRMENPAFDSILAEESSTNDADSKVEAGVESNEATTDDGDGDGDEPGDGDGDEPGDGDGDEPGDGDGDGPGDGDGDGALECVSDEPPGDCLSCIIDMCCDESLEWCLENSNCSCMLQCLIDGDEEMLCFETCDPSNENMQWLMPILGCAFAPCQEVCGPP